MQYSNYAAYTTTTWKCDKFSHLHHQLIPPTIRPQSYFHNRKTKTKKMLANHVISVKQTNQVFNHWLIIKKSTQNNSCEKLSADSKQSHEYLIKNSTNVTYYSNNKIQQCLRVHTCSCRVQYFRPCKMTTELQQRYYIQQLLTACISTALNGFFIFRTTL